MASDDSNDIKSILLNMSKDRYSETGSVFLPGDQTISKLYSANGLSLIDSAMTSTLYGLDIFGSATPAQMLQEQYGLTFYTRPMLNLSQDNILADPTFNHMGAKEGMSIGKYVRTMLDPMGDHGSLLVDNTNAFIPLLSNTLESLSGWQDPMLSTYQAPSGRLKESWSIGDSSNKVYGVYQLSSTHRNTRGNVLAYMFHVWQTWIASVYEGIMSPYPEFIRYNAVDYQTRIYRLTLDQTRTFVLEISACGAAFPLANPSGLRANYNRSSVANTEGDMLNQTWEAAGAFYFDPRIIQAFNEASTYFKPTWTPDIKANKDYVLLKSSEYRLFTYRAFPYIDTETSILQWWVPKAEYQRVLGNL